MHHGPGNRHPLLLAAAEAGREGGGAGAESNGPKQLIGASLGALPRNALDQQGDRDIFGCGERGKQVKQLKHETDRFAAEICPGPFVHALQVAAEDVALAGIMTEDCCDD